jgi:hypothetical protein
LNSLKLASRCFEDTGLNKRPATTGQGFTMMFACYEEIQKEKKRVLSSLSSEPNFLKPPVLLDIGDDHADDLSTVQDRASPP